MEATSCLQWCTHSVTHILPTAVHTHSVTHILPATMAHLFPLPSCHLPTSEWEQRGEETVQLPTSRPSRSCVSTSHLTRGARGEGGRRQGGQAGGDGHREGLPWSELSDEHRLRAAGLRGHLGASLHTPWLSFWRAFLPATAASPCTTRPEPGQPTMLPRCVTPCSVRGRTLSLGSATLTSNESMARVTTSRGPTPRRPGCILRQQAT